ncbi:hypothetical protein CRE_02911 [Caenorhabditis remanei]|uniref:Mitogen-activated protein kinase n=1 Tax=Caenorhabditis remanei TaxID=31234 RepID=E3LWM6_CAERE|nr:hypothetical protein CRE_02911 [Caenorhabditis remanei]
MTDDVDAHIHEKFELQKRLGKGAYGIVWKAYDKRSRETVALKKIFDAFRNPTDSQRTFREVMFLQEFGKHPNVIKLYNIFRADNDRDIYLAFEFMEADLHNVIKKGSILKDVHKQYIMCQLFRAIRFLHSGNVLHRDLKPSNVLLDADCRVKLADFGLARSLSSLEDYPEGQKMPDLTEYVATRWYRSPEILLAAKRYTKGVDMWSLGCILAEMLIGRALFPGSSTINQIERIMNTITKPSRQDIASIGSHYAASVLEKMPQRPRKPLDLIITQSQTAAIDMVQREVFGDAAFKRSINLVALYDLTGAHAPGIAESLRRHLLEIGELPGLLGKKFNRAKTGASESGTDPEEVESLGIALVQSYAPIIDEKKGIIADLLRIVSHELNVSVPASPEEFFLGDGTLIRGVHPPRRRKRGITTSHYSLPNEIPETPILKNTGGTSNQGVNRAPEKISEPFLNTNFQKPRVQQLFDNTHITPTTIVINKHETSQDIQLTPKTLNILNIWHTEETFKMPVMRRIQKLSSPAQLLVFAPQKRLTVEQCLVHPYVVQFHNPSEEPTLHYEVYPPLPDHVQLGIDDYRDRLYEMIDEKKASFKRIQHDKIRPFGEDRSRAPIAQAECSDTDYDTARSLQKSTSMDKNTSSSHDSSSGTLRERAQSAESRTSKGSNGEMRNGNGTITNGIKQRRRSIERSRLFANIKPSKILHPHKLISNY